MTPSQRRVLEALTEATRDGWPASVREVRVLAGYRSPSDPHRILGTLERDGYAVQHPRHRGGWLPYKPMGWFFATEADSPPTPSSEVVGCTSEAAA